MERLSSMDINTAAEYIPEVKKAVNDIHQAGVVHYDISPSNLMFNKENAITVIDFGRAGYIGQQIPPHRRTGVQRPEMDTYSTESDIDALKRTAG
ncbi:hypothetical protein L228DRAFT_248402 [Xylona heveae TC161]|uniref:EKC/KEOPS complex subunit BUD32 n=1 Tax=Xylona heveae (strain CBS 132557 / TC161) TaxID=1328760 RepID=A0A165G2Y2_XYLHT|nr:hypothetical protein L228DRAFT_248402 [Xylona heveae TC161]KZF21679.1 hypothetical protein L228DRAFT_248402 [Xylona heveae TC161]